MRKLAFFLCFFLKLVSVFSQVPSPSQFLGYPLGSQFTAHDKILGYFKKVSENNPRVKMQTYGRTYQNRELVLAFVSSPQNIQRLEEIRLANLATTNGIKPTVLPKVGIVWLSYNVHGNEASSSETAMKVLFKLSTDADSIKRYLENTVVVIDPCLNPDGRERYVNYYQSAIGSKPNPDPAAREHNEPWPGGRTNHYYFDLNRDWAWQTQRESVQRLKVYRQWMPQVHVDFHEQNYNEPYYFAPGAEPMHDEVTSWQRKFQQLVGKNNAKYFDAHGWSYFTKERFDLLYPSYGDTYPLCNGAIGMTYEQGGIGAGLAVLTQNGDTLTLADRIAHHYTASMATLETVSGHVTQLLTEFQRFFNPALRNAKSKSRSYVLKTSDVARMKKLCAWLNDNGIQYGFGANDTYAGLNYATGKVERFAVSRNDMVVSLNQPQAVLANVLFEPHTHITDTNTYDITAWAVPYLYNMDAFACKVQIKGLYQELAVEPAAVQNQANPFAWAFPSNTTGAMSFLNQLQQLQIRVRVADEAFVYAGVHFKKGTFLVYRAENTKLKDDLQELVTRFAKQYDVALTSLPSGLVDKGRDLGSSVYRLLKPNNIALLTGELCNAQSVGEVWHYLEKMAKVNVTLVNCDDRQMVDFSGFSTLIVPAGTYKDGLIRSLASWVKLGGKLVVLENANYSFVGKEGFAIQMRQQLSVPLGEELILGGIYRAQWQKECALNYNLPKSLYILKNETLTFEEGNLDGQLSITPNGYKAGVVGQSTKKLMSGYQICTQRFDKGKVIYFAFDPLFREMLPACGKLFENAVFVY